MQINLFVILGIILIALLVEFMVEAVKVSVVSTCKFFRRNGKRVSSFLSPILSLVFSIALCILAKIDILDAFGYGLSVLYVGSVVTGVIASLGANRVYDLITSFRDYNDKLAVESAPQTREVIK